MLSIYLLYIISFIKPMKNIGILGSKFQFTFKLAFVNKISCHFYGCFHLQILCVFLKKVKL